MAHPLFEDMLFVDRGAMKQAHYFAIKHNKRCKQLRRSDRVMHHPRKRKCFEGNFKEHVALHTGWEIGTSLDVGLPPMLEINSEGFEGVDEFPENLHCAVPSFPQGTVDSVACNDVQGSSQPSLAMNKWPALVTKRQPLFMPSYTKAEPQVVWEDTHTLVLYKPASWLCEVKNSIEENRHLIPPREASVEALVRSRNREHLIHFIMHKFGNQQDFLLASIEGGLPFRWGLVHRLDVDTSGLVLVGKTRIGFNHLKASLHCHAVRKEYICLVHGRLENDKGVIEKPIATSKSGRYAFISEKYGHWARTFYHVVGEYFLGDQCFALCRVEIQTGRTHQIRVHMSSLGHPLAGDTKYGSTVHFYTPRIFLHAERLEFSTIDGVRKSVMVPLPEDLTHILNNAWLQHSVD